MNLKEALAELEALGNEKTRKQNKKAGAGDNQFGVKRGDLRKLAKKIKRDHSLALSLWETGNIDARFLSILVLDSDALTKTDIDQMVKSVQFSQVSDWLTTYVVKHHSDSEALRQEWMKSSDPWAARTGWSLTSDRIAKSPEGLELSGLLDRIDSEMGEAPPEAQWTMNFALAHIGIHFPEHRNRAISIGEELGLYRDFPVSKGCTSPFAPVWIEAMVSRQ